LGDLALLGILEQRPGENAQTLYCLTQEPYLRRVMLKFANQFADQPLI
jgi:hypothetical protein